MIRLQVFEGTLQVPPEGHTIRRLVPVVYRKDATQKCQNASQCNRMPHRRVVLFSSVVCMCVWLSLSLYLCLCLFDAEAKQRRGRWHRAPLRQLLQCTKQVELWLALACARMYTVWLSGFFVILWKIFWKWSMLL